MSDKDKIKILPLGGLGYIGKNITLFEYKDEILIVDCGIMFPSEDMHGIDFLIPDFSYIVKNKKKVVGLVITHGHEDHIGAIPFLLQKLDVPIYGTKLTLGLIQSRLYERPPKKEPTLNEIHPRDIMQIGGFKVEFIRVNHSIIDGVGLAIGTEIGTIIHSGDYKIDFSPVDSNVTDIFRFADYGEQGVLLLMSDSTNAEKEGFTRSESVLSKKIVEIFSGAKGRVIVTTFASNIHRIQQVLDIAQRYNKKVVISGLTMQKNIEIATALGYLKYKDDLIIDIKAAHSLIDKKLVIIGTGSQGEPMSALSRIANGTHRHFAAKDGDTVIITASVIPGNERTVTNVVNALMKLGADVYYDQDEDIHVSGHGSSKELKLLLTITKPKFFMPIHGEYKHLKAHTLLAESLNIKQSRIVIGENGDILELTKKSFTKTGTLDLDQIYVEGKEIGDLSSNVIKERQTLALEGILSAVVIVSEGMLMNDPQIQTKGFMGESNAKLLKSLNKRIAQSANDCLKNEKSPETTKETITKDLRKYILKTIRKNPIIDIHVIEV